MTRHTPARHTPRRPDQLAGDERALYDRITGGDRATGPQHFPLVHEDGSLTGPFDAFLLNPVLGEAVQALGAALRFGGTLSDRAREIVILTVAAARESDFERMAHEAVGRDAGLTESDLAALRSGSVPDLADPTEDLVARLALALVGRDGDGVGDLDDGLWSAGTAALGEAGIFELTTLVGYYDLLARQLRVFRVG